VTFFRGVFEPMASEKHLPAILGATEATVTNTSRNSLQNFSEHAIFHCTNALLLKDEDDNFLSHSLIAVYGYCTITSRQLNYGTRSSGLPGLHQLDRVVFSKFLARMGEPHRVVTPNLGFCSCSAPLPDPLPLSIDNSRLESAADPLPSVFHSLC